ncbi:uncharacterized protein LOC110180178 [Drosophila serrata]|uniref:uncharacterized protein LOC110180178 n=1 Tax=Drosophila serrata TaxID=7274 RepID=UPI000A1D268C|nr:uncharacterized protein LOC110180178 [Drosophila serrata]
MTPEPPQQKLITRTTSTPQLSGLGVASTKGVMQRFMASHGMHPQAFLENGNSTTGITTVTLSTAAIEPESEGRPLFQEYVPVEKKNQQELQDLKPLKRLSKTNRHNTLKASLDKLSTGDEADADEDDDEDSEVDCYGPGELRNV